VQEKQGTEGGNVFWPGKGDPPCSSSMPLRLQSVPLSLFLYTSKAEIDPVLPGPIPNAQPSGVEPPTTRVFLEAPNVHEGEALACNLRIRSASHQALFIHGTSGDAGPCRPSPSMSTSFPFLAIDMSPALYLSRDIHFLRGISFLGPEAQPSAAMYLDTETMFIPAHF